MSLSSRQRMRLKKICRMIDSTGIVHSEVEEINQEYALDLESVISLIQRSNSPERVKNIASETETELSVFSSKKPEEENIPEFEDTNEELPDVSSDSHEIPIPKWAKSLWKKIAMKCHPDRLNHQEITAIEIARRQIYLRKAQKAYELQDWDEILYIAACLEEYTSELSYKEQSEKLQAKYITIKEKITAIQNTISWQWGTSWENLELRIRIITFFLFIWRSYLDIF